MGFNTLYNVTDIPSIFSGSTLVYFDPNVKYLSNRIRHPQQPGIRVNFANIGHEYVHHYSDQFKPYEHIFGCDLFEAGFKNYAGTIVRLPLRTEASAISANLYSSKSDVERLVKIMFNNADSMLLFTQSVRAVEFYVLEEDAQDGSEMKLVFRFEKSLKSYFAKHEINFGESEEVVTRKCNDEFARQSSLLRAATVVLKNPKE